MTPFGSFNHPSTPDNRVGGLLIPPSSSLVGGEFAVYGDNGPGSVGGPSGTRGHEDLKELMPDPGFVIDEDGLLVDTTEANIISDIPEDFGGNMMLSDVGVSAQMRKDPEHGLVAGNEVSFYLGSRLFSHSPIHPSFNQYNFSHTVFKITIFTTFSDLS